MRPYDVIVKKRDGGRLSESEIRGFVHGYVEGLVPDYQMAAFLMAVYFTGMTDEETAALTMAMVSSGETVDLSSIPGKKVDKHSTGGVGDKTSLVLGPMVAAAGVPVPKMSGRGLGHTGGTLDKLESIPGFRTGLTMTEFLDQVRRIGIAIAGQTGKLVPADGKMYALRDVTGTVDSIPLIASSIMSKKIAGGADAIVLDVKTGTGAFMKRFEDAVRLAQAMVNIGTLTGRETVAVVTDMNQPLGRAVGNALEVREAVETLSGRGPDDLVELCLNLGSRMLALAGVATDASRATEILKEVLDSGKALEKLCSMVEAQGGDAAVIRDPSLLPKADAKIPVLASAPGFVRSLDALEVGRASMMLGAGRVTKESPIDPSVGVVLEKKVGDRVEKGEPLAWVYARDPGSASEIVRLVERAYSVGEQPVERPRLVRAVVTAKGVETVDDA